MKTISSLTHSPYTNLKVPFYILIFALFFSADITNANAYIDNCLLQLTPKEARGIVTDEDGTPLSGVIIIVSKSLIHTTSDNEGRFSVSNIPDGASITFMLRGYKTHTLPPLMSSNTAIKVKMMKDPHYVEAPDTSGHLSKKINKPDQIIQNR